MRGARVFLLWVVTLLNAAVAQADELRPAYIELTQQTAQQWSLLWKASAQSRLGRNGQILIPQGCASEKAVQIEIVDSNIIRRAELYCSAALSGKKVGLAGLEFSNTDALVRIKPLETETQTLRLTPREPSVVIPDLEHAVAGNILLAYTIIGIEHIVFGFDHFFFVLALVLLLTGWQRIALTVTAFTVAHSVTLIGTTLGYLALPQRPVEAVIALSIVFLAVEVLKLRPGHPRLSERFPWVVAFLFGLLHGFGFAGALAEIGLPQEEAPLALLSFNVGVELGQLGIVLVSLLLLKLLARIGKPSVIAARTTTAYAIGCVSMFWLLERVI